MSSINQLSAADAFSAAMQIPVYDTGNGQPRKVSGQQLVDFVQENLVSDASQPFRLIAVTVAQLAANYPASSWTGAAVYCANGDAGSPCIAISNGTDWKRVALGAAVSAT